jgi:hypothetical protein
MKLSSISRSSIAMVPEMRILAQAYTSAAASAAAPAF